MERFEKKTEILNDLLHINSDCSASCRSFIPSENDRPAAQHLINRVEGLCRDCIAELHMRIDPTYGDPADAVDLKGGIYRAWVSDDDIASSRMTPEVLSVCEQKVQGIKRAYEQALEACEDLSDDIRVLLNTHLGRVSRTFDFISTCRTENLSFA